MSSLPLLPHPLGYSCSPSLSSHFPSLSLTLFTYSLTKLNRHEQLTLRAGALREELHSKTERILNDIIRFKVHVQKSLEDLEGLVVEEVERELGGEDGGEGGGDGDGNGDGDGGRGDGIRGD